MKRISILAITAVFLFVATASAEPVAKVIAFPGGAGLEEFLDGMDRSKITITERRNDYDYTAILIVPLFDESSIEIFEAGWDDTHGVIIKRLDPGAIAKAPPGHGLLFWDRVPEGIPASRVVLSKKEEGYWSEHYWSPAFSGIDDSLITNGEFIPFYSSQTLLSVDEAMERISGFCEYYKITHKPDLDKQVEGVQLFGFLVDYSDTVLTNTYKYCYAWVNSVSKEIKFEEAGFVETDAPVVYANMPDNMFPIPKRGSLPIPYDYFTPPEYIWGTAYYYDDKSVMELYQAQLRDEGFVDLGEVGEVESLWTYERKEDGATLVVEMYGGDEKFVMNVYVNYPD